MIPSQKFIAWDWNGTLQDDFFISIAAANHALRAFGKEPVDADRYRECFDVPIDRMYRNLGLNDQEILHCLLTMQDHYFELYDEMAPSTDFRQGAREILDFAASFGYRHVVLSNHVVEAVEKDLARLKKRSAFHEILAWPNKKTQFTHPKSDFLKSYMDRHGLKGEDGIIVGDSPEEVRVARSLGLVSVAISGGYCSVDVLKRAEPDYLISSLDELKPLLQTWRQAA